MLAHHAFMGLDPFSYTEPHRRWVTDEWGSEIALATLFRAFGNLAYSMYAIVLGGLCLVTTRGLRPGPRRAGWPGRRHRPRARRRHRRDRGGRPGARLLPGLAPARAAAADQGAGQPALAACSCPLLCLLWVNTHGSILLGLLVLAVELGWSLIPERFVQRIGGVHQSPFTGSLALALLGSVLASCITPYGPGSPGLRRRRVAQRPDRAVHQRMELTQLPFGHDAARLLRSAGRPGGLCIWTRRIPLLEGSLGLFLFVEALQTQRLAVYLLIVAAGWPPPCRHAAPWGTTARRWAGGGLVVAGHRHPGHPGGPGRVGGVEPARAGLRLPARAPGPDLHGVHLGRLLGGPAPGHLRRRADGPLRGPGAHRVHGGDEPDHEPGPRAVRFPRLLRRLGAGTAVGALPRPATRAGTWWTAPSVALVFARR